MLPKHGLDLALVIHRRRGMCPPGRATEQHGHGRAPWAGAAQDGFSIHHAMSVIKHRIGSNVPFRLVLHLRRLRFSPNNGHFAHSRFMIWSQNYAPLGSLALSALIAALPVVTLL